MSARRRAYFITEGLYASTLVAWVYWRLYLFPFRILYTVVVEWHALCVLALRCALLRRVMLPRLATHTLVWWRRDCRYAGAFPGQPWLNPYPDDCP